MKRKHYEEPSLEVVVMKQQPILLAGSEQVNATMNGTWTEEEI